MPVVLIVVVMSFVAVLRRVVRLEDMADCFSYLLVSGVPAVVKCLYEAAAESALAVCIVCFFPPLFPSVVRGSAWSLCGPLLEDFGQCCC